MNSKDVDDEEVTHEGPITLRGMVIHLQRRGFVVLRYDKLAEMENANAMVTAGQRD